MKFLHLADLHLGKRLNDIPLLEDQRIVLSQVVDIARREGVEAVLIAGDVYQKSSPQSEAMTLFNDFLVELTNLNLKVFVISGNHDSDRRISYFSPLIRKSGVYASEAFDGKLQSIELHDGHGPLWVHLLPFVKPVHVRRAFPEEAAPESYEAAVAQVLAHSPVDTSVRNVLLCHQFVTGAQLCDSEELAVGGLDNVSAALFDDFDYVALGHIHKPQTMGRATLRYAGSLMKYSLSEADHKKSVTVVDMGPKGEVEVTAIPLTFPRDVREVEGSLEAVLDMPWSEDYVRVTLTDELVAPDAQVRIAAVFPNMIRFAVRNSKTSEEYEVLERDTLQDKDIRALFDDFYRQQNNDAHPSEAHFALLEEILTALKEEDHEAD